MARLLGVIGVLLFGAAVGVSALAVRQNQPPTATSDDVARSGAASAAPRMANIAPLRFGPGYAARSAQISPDGKLATAMTNDWSAEALFALSDDPTSGFVTAREIARLPTGAGQMWLSAPTALLLAVSEPTKRSALSVTGADGKSVQLGSAAYIGLAAPSPDGRWIAVAEGLAQPSQIRIFDRTGSVAPRVIASGMPPIVGRIQWDASSRVLYPNGRTVVAVDLSGHETTHPMSAGESAFGIMGMSPDLSIAVIGVNVSTGEGLRLLDGGSTRVVPSGVLQPLVWVGPHEMLARHADGQLFAADARGNERALGVAMKSSDVRVLGYSAPYLLWIDNVVARVHLSDLTASKDVTVGANPLPSGAQPNGDGRFLITRDDVNFGADILSGPLWFASLPATPPPVPTRAGAAAGYRRIASDEGGWSMDIPEKWVAETGNLRGAEIASFELQGADLSGNAPTADQQRIRVTLLPDYDGLSLEELGKRGALSGTNGVVEQIATTVASQPAVRTLMAGAGVPKPFDLPHLYWHFRSPYFANRVVAIDVWPATGQLRTAVDHAISTFELFAPTPPSTAAISRAQAIDAVRSILERAGRVDRIAAKLVTNHELEQGSAFGHSYTVDPDDLLWVVAATGDFASMRLGPMPLPDASPDSPPRDRLIVNILRASTGDAFGFMSGGDGAWPAWFDALGDRAP
jgi:hypothetical protein